MTGFSSLAEVFSFNGLRYAPHAFCGVLVGGIGHHPGALPGRDNAILTETTSSHANCLTARRACARRAAAVPPPHLRCTASPGTARHCEASPKRSEWEGYPSARCAA